MAKSISALLQDAEELISKKIASANAPVHAEDDVTKLARELMAESEVEPSYEDVSDFTITEKLAHAAALLDTLINMDTLVKVAAFEDEAIRSGHSPEDVSEFFEKRGSVSFRSVTELIPGFRG